MTRFMGPKNNYTSPQKKTFPGIETEPKVMEVHGFTQPATPPVTMVMKQITQLALKLGRFFLWGFPLGFPNYFVSHLSKYVFSRSEMPRRRICLPLILMSSWLKLLWNWERLEPARSASLSAVSQEEKNIPNKKQLSTGFFLRGPKTVSATNNDWLLEMESVNWCPQNLNGMIPFIAAFLGYFNNRN